MLWVKVWEEVLGEACNDNLKCKATFAEIREYGLKQAARGRTTLHPSEISQTFCTVAVTQGQWAGWDGNAVLWRIM